MTGQFPDIGAAVPACAATATLASNATRAAQVAEESSRAAEHTNDRISELGRASAEIGDV